MCSHTLLHDRVGRFCQCVFIECHVCRYYKWMFWAVTLGHSKDTLLLSFLCDFSSKCTRCAHLQLLHVKRVSKVPVQLCLYYHKKAQMPFGELFVSFSQSESLCVCVCSQSGHCVCVCVTLESASVSATRL